MHYLENRETPKFSGSFQINTILIGRCRESCAIFGIFEITSKLNWFRTVLQINREN